MGTAAARGIRSAQAVAHLRTRAADPGPVAAVHAQLRCVRLRHRRHAAAGSRSRPAAHRLSITQENAQLAVAGQATGREPTTSAPRAKRIYAWVPASHSIIHRVFTHLY